MQCVCVWRLNPQGMTFNDMTKIAIRFSRQESKSVKDKSKVKPYTLLGPSHPHMIHSPKDAAHNCLTCTMKDKVNFLLACRGQGILQIQHISSEYTITA
jgi:hypothetical protein